MYSSPLLKDHSACFSDCTVSYFRDNQSLNYDFSNLSQVGSLMSGPSFTSRGTKFFHFFNISLCGNEVSSAGIEGWGDHTETETGALLTAELSPSLCKCFPLDLVPSQVAIGSHVMCQHRDDSA